MNLINGGQVKLRVRFYPHLNWDEVYKVHEIIQAKDDHGNSREAAILHKLDNSWAGIVYTSHLVETK